jgi:hypothetical protein
MSERTKNIRANANVQTPISLKLKEINRDLEHNENEMMLLEIDGISEMLVNYVRKAEDIPLRFMFIDMLIIFVKKYAYFARIENLNVIKIILLNELFKKNQNEPSVLRLIKDEMRFTEKNAAAYKSVIEQELRELCMLEYNIPDRSDFRYRSIVKPMIKDFEDFYYKFR